MSLLLLLRSRTTTPRTFSLSLSSATPPQGSTVTATATLTDSDGSPLAGKTIWFTVTGANPDSGSDITDASGIATFDFVVTNVGADTVRADWGPATGIDTLSTDTASTRVYRHDGFTTTVNDSFLVGGSLLPMDVTHDGDNLITLVYDGATTYTVRKHSGFSSTVTDSFTVSTGCSGLAWDGTNLLSCYNGGDVKKHEGFSSAILDSFSTGKENHGLAWDGTNVIVAHQNLGDDTLTRYVGFSSVVDDTLTMPYSGGLFALTGCAWYDGNLYTSSNDGGGGGNDDLSVHVGFTDSLTTIDSPSSQVSGIGWTVGMSDDASLVVSVMGSGHIGRRTARLVP